MATIFQSHWDSSQREGDRKEEWDRLKGPNYHPNFPQIKQISSCKPAKHDMDISLKSCSSHGFREDFFKRLPPPPPIISLWKLMTPGHGQFGLQGHG